MLPVQEVAEHIVRCWIVKIVVYRYIIKSIQHFLEGLMRLTFLITCTVILCHPWKQIKFNSRCVQRFCNKKLGYGLSFRNCNHSSLVLCTSRMNYYCYTLLQVVQPHLTKMSDRKAELERKKAKLAQIRAEKEARRKEREALDTQAAAKVRTTRFF